MDTPHSTMFESSVSPDLRAEANYSRFASLLSSGRCPQLPYDKVLFEVGGCVITPTLGSILPYWLLVIPRASLVNFVQWRSEKGIEPDELVGDILVGLGIDRSRAIWFEHGPKESGSEVGCGVDHAHLHIIVDAPFSFEDFIAAAKDATHAQWQEQFVRQPYQSIKKATSYLFAASANRALVAENVECVGSQFFRRVIAGLVQQTDAWNYKTHPHIENVRKTLVAFGSQLPHHIAQ